MTDDYRAMIEPAIIVIFGITGDLAQRYLLPALYHLIKDDLLPAQTVILGVSRRDISAEKLLEKVELCIGEVDGVCDPAAVAKLRQRLQMMHMDITGGDDYARLLTRLNDIEAAAGVCLNRLYYLAIPPQVISPIVRLLGEHGLNARCPHGTAATRLLVEKPFGYDLASAGELIADTAAYFAEPQIFRIDHYLAKETVQNILTFRLNNPIFENLWSGRFVHDIQITVSEKIGIEGRAAFYEQTGALRDMVQSHLLQLLAIVTMEPPAALTSESIHDAKLALLEAVQPLPPDTVDNYVVRGQYANYRSEVGNPESSTETFAALLLHIDSYRWRGTPVLLRTGKALEQRRTDITLRFKSLKPGQENILSFRIQPNEGIALNLCVKKPGLADELQTVEMDFSYARSFADAHGHPDAYERVLIDAVRGDHTLFATGDEVLASWRIIQPALEAAARGQIKPETYPSGFWGPPAATNLARRAGTIWR